MTFLDIQVLRSEPGAPIAIEPRLRITDPQVSDRAELVVRTAQGGYHVEELFVVADPLLDMGKVVKAITEEADDGDLRDAALSNPRGLAWIETYGGFAWTLDRGLADELLRAVTA